MLLLLIAMVAMTLNRGTGIGVRLASDSVSATQIRLGQQAAIAQAQWKLVADRNWRTTTGGEDYTYAGIVYNRKVLNSTLSCFEDAVRVSVSLKEGTQTARATYLWRSDFFIADSGNDRIRKVSEAGKMITTVAGNGYGGYSGDGGLAVNARLDYPQGVSADADGNLYIADTNNHMVRRVDADSGIITRLAGRPNNSGYSGDGGSAYWARLDTPEGLFATSSGDVYIADTENSRIRKVDGSTGIITTVAGNGDSGYDGDGGPAVDAEIKEPEGVYVTSAGVIYVVDTDNHAIRKVDSGGIITTVAGTGSGGYSGDGGPAVNAKLNGPDSAFVTSDGVIYIADTNNHAIRKVDSAGIITTVAGIPGNSGFSGDCGPATSAKMNKPSAVYVNPAGEIIIGDTDNHRIRRVDGSTQIITTVTGTGSRIYGGDGGMAFDAAIDNPRGVSARAPPQIQMNRVSYLD